MHEITRGGHEGWHVEERLFRDVTSAGPGPEGGYGLLQAYCKPALETVGSELMSMLTCQHPSPVSNYMLALEHAIVLTWASV